MEWESITQAERKIAELNEKTKPVQNDPDVKKHLEELHRKYFIASIDKASNNFTVTSREFPTH